MSVIENKGGWMRLDVTREVKAFDAFMKGASPEKKMAAVAWYLRFMELLEPELRRGTLQAAQQINAHYVRIKEA